MFIYQKMGEPLFGLAGLMIFGNSVSQSGRAGRGKIPKLRRENLPTLIS
jgi:hypothetical protein